MLGFLGHILGLWRFSVGLGIMLKIRILQGLVYLSSEFLGDYAELTTDLRETLHVFRTFADLPHWFKVWYYTSGVLEFIVSTALFVVAIFLWNKRVAAVRVFYLVIGASIGVHLVNIICSLLFSESLGVMKMVMDVPVMLVKISLVPVVYFADKSVLGTHARDSVHFTLKRRVPLDPVPLDPAGQSSEGQETAQSSGQSPKH